MERLQKVMAHAGIASRRKCEQLMLDGKVEVNGKQVTELGFKVDPKQDEILVNGRKIKMEQYIYMAFHKPKGVITSLKDPKGRKVITDFIKKIPERVYPVGRLDYDSEGLLLLTNDGELANVLMHPRHHVAKTYHAYVKGVPHGEILEQLRRGIQLEDGMTAPAEADYIDVSPDAKESILTITIYEGKNRQVRRMFESVGYPVQRLKRVRFGPVELERLPRGKYRSLTKDEIGQLLSAMK